MQMRALLGWEKDGTDRQTDRQETDAVRFPPDADSIINSVNTLNFKGCATVHLYSRRERLVGIPVDSMHEPKGFQSSHGN